MTNRVSRFALEVIHSTDEPARMSRLAAEVVHGVDDSQVRVSRMAIELLYRQQNYISGARVTTTIIST